MPPNRFESEVESFLEGSHGDRTHIKRADHPRLHHYAGHYCSWTIGAQQGRVAWRYCSRWGVAPHRPRAPDGKALPFTLQLSTIPATTGIGAPLTSRHTRYVAIHPIRRGVMPTDRVHCLIDNKLARGFSR